MQTLPCDYCCIGSLGGPAVRAKLSRAALELCDVQCQANDKKGPSRLGAYAGRALARGKRRDACCNNRSAPRERGCLELHRRKRDARARLRRACFTRICQRLRKPAGALSRGHFRRGRIPEARYRRSADRRDREVLSRTGLAGNRLRYSNRQSRFAGRASRLGILRDRTRRLFPQDFEPARDRRAARADAPLAERFVINSPAMRADRASWDPIPVSRAPECRKASLPDYARAGPIAFLVRTSARTARHLSASPQ